MKFLQLTHICSLCGNPVSLESCRTDEHGWAVHEICYVKEIVLGRHADRLLHAWDRVELACDRMAANPPNSSQGLEREKPDLAS